MGTNAQVGANGDTWKDNAEALWDEMSRVATSNNITANLVVGLQRDRDAMQIRLNALEDSIGRRNIAPTTTVPMPGIVYVIMHRCDGEHRPDSSLVSVWANRDDAVQEVQRLRDGHGGFQAFTYTIIDRTLR